MTGRLLTLTRLRDVQIGNGCAVYAGTLSGEWNLSVCTFHHVS